LSTNHAAVSWIHPDFTLQLESRMATSFDYLSTLTGSQQMTSAVSTFCVQGWHSIELPADGKLRMHRTGTTAQAANER